MKSVASAFCGQFSSLDQPLLYFYKTFLGGYLGIYTALGRWPERLLKIFENLDTLVCTDHC